MGGWHLRMTWGQEVCYASLHSEPASALGLPTVWSLWGNPGMARCWEMSTLHAGYIPQHKVTSASSSGSLGFIMNFHCVWSVAGWLIVYQDGDYLYPGQYSQTICRSQYVMIPPSGWEHEQYIPGEQVLTVANLLLDLFFKKNQFLCCYKLFLWISSWPSA